MTIWLEVNLLKLWSLIEQFKYKFAVKVAENDLIVTSRRGRKILFWSIYKAF